MTFVRYAALVALIGGIATVITGVPRAILIRPAYEQAQRVRPHTATATGAICSVVITEHPGTVSSVTRSQPIPIGKCFFKWNNTRVGNLRLLRGFSFSALITHVARWPSPLRSKRYDRARSQSMIRVARYLAHC